MLRAVHEDKKLVVELLSQSFEDNKSVNHIIAQSSKKSKNIRALMDYSFEICNLFGEVWLCDDKKACALLLFPHEKRPTLKSIWLDLKLIFRAIGLRGIQKALKREAQIKNLQPKEKMVYLWFVGVDPIDQHQGIGSRLLNEIITHADKKGLPIYLETSTLKNLPWYDRFGFQIYDELELTYTLYFLKRIPVK